MQREAEEESERSVDDLLTDVDKLTDDGGSTEQPATATTTQSGSDAEEASSGGRLAGLFSPRLFLVALLLSLVAVVAGGAVPIVGVVGRLVGLFVVAFAIGAVASDRHYLEVGLAGAVASGLGFVVSTLTSAFFPFAVRLLSEYGIAIAGVGAGVGALAALAGHYFGRDLRDGLSREL
jgi:hypothetical protein